MKQRFKKHLLGRVLIVISLVFTFCLVFREHKFSYTIVLNGGKCELQADCIAEYLYMKMKEGWSTALDNGTKLFDDFREQESVRDIISRKKEELKVYWDSIKNIIVWESEVK